MRWLRGIVLMVAAATMACSQPPEPKRYEVRGQILSFDPQRSEVVVDHEDIEGFMPAMVMPYKVQDPSLLEGKKPGDMVTATLVVEEVQAYLTTLTTTGHQPLKTPAAGPLITDADILKDGDRRHAEQWAQDQLRLWSRPGSFQRPQDYLPHRRHPRLRQRSHVCARR